MTALACFHVCGLDATSPLPLPLLLLLPELAQTVIDTSGG
jgi:hypothetical protein